MQATLRLDLFETASLATKNAKKLFDLNCGFTKTKNKT